MKTISLYDPSTGLFDGTRITGDESTIALNIPAGMAAIDGEHDHLSRCVDLGTGDVIDWQPPQPTGSDLVDHVWSSDMRRWRAVDTVAGRRRKLADAVNAMRAHALAAGEVMLGGVPFDADLASCDNLTRVLSGRAALGVPSTTLQLWRAADNTDHMLGGAQLAQLAGLLLARGDAVYAASWAIKAELDAADTLAALDAVDLNAGWPT